MIRWRSHHPALFTRLLMLHQWRLACLRHCRRLCARCGVSCTQAAAAAQCHPGPAHLLLFQHSLSAASFIRASRVKREGPS